MVEGISSVLQAGAAVQQYDGEAVTATSTKRTELIYGAPRQLRKDIVEKDTTRDQLLGMSKGAHPPYYTTPRVL